MLFYLRSNGICHNLLLHTAAYESVVQIGNSVISEESNILYRLPALRLYDYFNTNVTTIHPNFRVSRRPFLRVRVNGSFLVECGS